MFKRALILAVPVIALLAGVASAQDYPVDTVGGAVDADGNVVVAADGFIPNAVVHYTVEFTPFSDENALGVLGGYEGEVAFGPLQVASIVEEGTTVANAAGAVDIKVTPRGEGTYDISMTDGTNTKVASVAVGADSPTGPSAQSGSSTPAGEAARTLPRTGTDSTSAVAIAGAGLVLVGAAVAYAARRRRPVTTV